MNANVFASLSYISFVITNIDAENLF